MTRIILFCNSPELERKSPSNPHVLPSEHFCLWVISAQQSIAFHSLLTRFSYPGEYARLTGLPFTGAAQAFFIADPHARLIPRQYKYDAFTLQQSL